MLCDCQENFWTTCTNAPCAADSVKHRFTGSAKRASLIFWLHLSGDQTYFLISERHCSLCPVIVIVYYLEHHNLKKKGRTRQKLFSDLESASEIKVQVKEIDLEF